MQTLLSFLRKNTMAMLNQMLRWLNKPKVVRLGCLASSVVGLLCYALSSSFNHLLGNWSWWKMLLYIVFSFIVFLAVLFAPARSRSTSLRLESHVSFVVLIITSVYSFLFDNLVKGKPDAYSLVSCAAFATMSLGLSNLTQFGFQIDLLYFFCGGLLVQLMKIKMWLVIVGGGFSYSLLQLCNYPRHTQRENLPLQLQNLVNIQVDPRSVSSSSHEEAYGDVNSTQGTSPEDGDLRFQDHLHTQSNSPSQDGIQQQLMNCIKELEKENKMLVPFVCGHVDKYLEAEFGSKEEPYADINLVLDALPSEIMRRLKEIVKLMVEGGFVEECSDIYSTWRREFVEQCLQELQQFQLPIKKDFMKWSAACKATWKMFFPNERRLCDFLFSGLSDAADVSFEKFCKSLTIVLLKHAHTITIQSYTQHTLLIDAPRMLMSLGELEPEFIAYNNLSFVCDVRDIQQRLAMINRDIIYPDILEAPATDGGLHLITKESMKYILGICEGTIKQRDGQTCCIENSSFWVVIGKMIELLESELELESTRLYRDPALRYIFMINNLMYIKQKIRDLKFDDEWFQQRKGKVTQKSNLYLRTWEKMMEFLKVEANESAKAYYVVAELMIEKIRLFNLHFEKTCTIQSTWTVSNKQLRKRITKCIEGFLLPEYGEFCDGFLAVLGDEAYEYIKFGTTDIQNYLSHLFIRDEETNLKYKKNV